MKCKDCKHWSSLENAAQEETSYGTDGGFCKIHNAWMWRLQDSCIDFIQNDNVPSQENLEEELKSQTQEADWLREKYREYQKRTWDAEAFLNKIYGFCAQAKLLNVSQEQALQEIEEIAKKYSEG